jgi:DNA-directed RNA polymerase subunit RPC12/RpoP
LKEKNIYKCTNTKCEKVFQTPKSITYLVCPFCDARIENPKQAQEKCFHHFGYLSVRQADEIIPTECIECMRSIECMLAKTNSKEAAHEIQKLYEQMDPTPRK